MEFDRLNAHVASSYLLQHEQAGHGVGKTQAIVNNYFVKAAPMTSISDILTASYSSSREATLSAKSSKS